MEEEYDNYFDDNKPLNKKYDDYFDSPIKSKSPLSKMFHRNTTNILANNTSFGKSKYDQNINWGADINPEDVQDSLNEHRAQEQSGLAQTGLMLGRATTKALTEVAKLPGVVGGIIASVGAPEGEKSDMAFNNAWIRTFDNLNKDINTELMPVYTAKAVREGNLWDNITSTSFWATDGADGIGFIAAMFVPGAIFEYAGLGGKMINGLANSQKLARFTAMAGKAEEATTVLKGIGLSGKNIDSILGVTGNTIFEAGAEAKGVGDDLDRKKPEFIKQYAQNHLKELSKNIPQYIDVPGSIIMGPDGLQHGTLPHKELNPEYQNIQAKALELAENDYKEQRALAMRNTFVSNVAILLGPNAIMHKALYGKAAKTFLKPSEEGLKGVAKRIGKSGGRVGKAFVSEGFWEEGSQTTVENMYVNKAMNNQLGKDNDFNVGDFTKEYVNTLNTTEGQKAIFLGGALGGPMMSIQGRKEDLRNRERTNAVLEGVQKQITNFNDIFDTEVYKKGEDNKFIYKRNSKGQFTSERELDNKKVAEVAKALNFTEQQSALFDFAVQTGNTQVVETLKQQAIFNMILPAIQNGELGIQALEQKLNEDVKFNEIIERDKNSDEKNKSKQFVKETLETAKYLQKQNEKFQDFSKDVIELKNDKATPEQKQGFLNRLNASYLNVKHQIKNDEKLLESLKEKRNNLFEELGIDPLYDENAEFPTAKMKNGLVTDEELKNRAEKTKKALQENSLLKKTEEEYDALENKIKKQKQDIADIWQGKLIDETFDDYLKEEEKKDKELSDENIQKHQDIIDTIKNQTSSTNLKDYTNTIPKDIKDNPVVQEIITETEQILKDKEQAIINSQKDEVRNESEVTPVTASETVTENSDNSFEQTDDVDLEDNVNESKKISSDTKYKALQQNKVKLISKNQKTGEKFEFISQDWIDYENIPEDKTGRVLNFSINNNPGSNKDLILASEIATYLQNNDINKAIQYIINSNKNNIKSIDELREFLTNYLPLNVGIKDSNVHAPIETLPSTKVSAEIFNSKDKETRLLIVNSILEGNSLDNITIKIAGQMPGTLQTSTDENGNVSENSISQLQAFQTLNLVDENGKLNKKGYQYIRENLFVVEEYGNIVNPKGDRQIKYRKVPHPVTKKLELLPGEFYLKIPMTNGEDFYLKLNTLKVSENEANVLFDIAKYRFKTNDRKTLNKATLLKDIEKENPDLVNKIKTLLPTEYELIKSTKNENEISLKDIIDLLIYDGSKNEKSQFRFDYASGTFKFGNITVHSLNELTTLEDNIKVFLTEQKRRAINFGNPKNVNTKALNTHNINYLNYLIQNKVLNTNAVVGVDNNGNIIPTFGGYTNIYLETKPIIKSTKKLVQPKFTKAQEDYLDKYVGKDAGLNEEETQNIIDDFFNVATGNKNNEEITRNSEKNSVSLQEEPELTNAFGTNPKFQHEIPGTTENKEAQKLTEEVKEDNTKLSNEQIDLFFEDETFLKGMDEYKNENNVSDNDLTYKDFEKIIELNYKPEEIKKICKGN